MKSSTVCDVIFTVFNGVHLFNENTLPIFTENSFSLLEFRSVRNFLDVFNCV